MYDAETLRANARLISAAPDLLAACQGIWGAWQNHHQLDDELWEGRAPLLAVKAAIRKATRASDGETP